MLLTICLILKLAKKNNNKKLVRKCKNLLLEVL